MSAKSNKIERIEEFMAMWREEQTLWSIKTTLTGGHSTSLQLSTRHLVVVQTSYDIAMTSGVHWVGGIIKKVVPTCSKCEITYRFSKTYENTYEELQFCDFTKNRLLHRYEAKISEAYSQTFATFFQFI